MSQTGVVTRLAVRELWMTFRLLVLLAGFVGAGAVVALLPAPLPDVVLRLALGVGAATVVAGSLAAWSLAEERERGHAAWLVGRSVSRETVLVGWFLAVAALCLLGVAVAGLLGWLIASAVTLRLEAAAFAAALGAVAATVPAALALGLLLGALLRPGIAAAAAAIALAGLGVVAWQLREVTGGLVPGAAFVDLAALREGATMQVVALRSSGAALVAAALLLVAARLALERVDL